MDSTRGMNLLIVDDSHADTRLLQMWLKELQVIRSILVAANGQSALALLSSNNAIASDDGIDLILLDGNLPDMSGLEVLAELKRRPEFEGLGVLMLSGTYHPRDSDQAMLLGADGYLAKPFDGEDFGRLIQWIEAFWRRRS